MSQNTSQRQRGSIRQQMHGQVTQSQSRWRRYQIELELPLEVALDAYFVFEHSKKRCSDYMAGALFWGIREANKERSDQVTVDVTYSDKGWKSWLLKICAERPHFATTDDQERNLEALADLIEGL